jgi:N6-adenosine-specific RNA methylase IME4
MRSDAEYASDACRMRVQRISSPNKERTQTADEIAVAGTWSETALELPENLSFEDWERTGALLGRIGRACQWWIGDWLNFGERKYGEKYSQAMEATGYEYSTLNSFRYVAQQIELVRRRTSLSWSHHETVAALDPPEQDDWLEKAAAEGWSVSELRRQLKTPPLLDAPDPPSGEYRTIVIDPPWPMEKIEREVRPNQAAPLDYLTMDADELRGLEVPAADDAHLYLWTTHRFLPLAFELTEAWGFAYQCLLTWRKNVGITPFSWMYSTEHVVFARRGSLDLLVNGRRLDFEAKVRGHSRKPDEFYELVREVSPGPRIDMFARGKHEGFDSWGNETERFADAA